KGLIITDALGMGAITQEYGPGDAAIQAILAGVDILLTPENYEAAYDNVEAAVKAGTIPVSRIEESAARVLALKKDILDSRDMLAK
ncbi:MAG: glycoside hydrolase family 3, partial [Lachnospiraceae bacterium]|nr:glycoside hydrolase family 3 [Lachnospiraceae bacterium]